jgi:hypothetical protein
MPRPDVLPGPGDLSRRDFLGLALRLSVAAGFAPGAARLFAAPTNTAGSPSYAVNPLRPWWPEYRPPAAPVDLSRPLRFTFGWKFWDAESGPSKKTGKPKGGPKIAAIADIGSLSIERFPGPDGIRYGVKQNRPFGCVEGEILCGPGPAEPPIEWRITESLAGDTGGKQKAAPAFSPASTIRGKASGGKITLDAGSGPESFDAPGAVSEFSLLCNPAALAACGERPFTFVERGAILRPSQACRRDPAADLELGGAKIAAWLQSGTGVEPLHYLVDPDGRVLCRTAFATSLVLLEIADV